uniref:Uncharacterized protein n=1 Tax=Catharus ustulatus TaxID=91951 RepID=A0A8C3V3A7_CATUS
ITCIPLPLHTGHFSTAPLFPASFLVIPLYRSSRDTPNWCTTFLPLEKQKGNINTCSVLVKTNVHAQSH